MIAKTPKPPYYTVIFTSIRSIDDPDYNVTSERMIGLAKNQDGFLGIESARSEIGITVSYWRDENAIRSWKANLEHLEAQALGRKKWYDYYTVRIARVEREYSFSREI